MLRAMKQALSGPPSPDEFRKQLAEFMKQQFPGVTNPKFAAEESGDDGEAPTKSDDEFQFAHKPRDVKAHLDRFVIKQDEAKKVPSVALCDHYNHGRLAR